ncbi:MAG: arylamine N-acetyltransferase [Candidatus Heimdallarchaeota archaeon]|nr:arylamine N-acetyltransferase [Candidatus Heimdallarchaeota archaeon]
MDIQLYLERIGMTENVDLTPRLQLLRTLQYQHILHVPFENLNVMAKVPIVLETDLLWKKIVENKRGGFCFEQNGLFCSILKYLGFDAWMSEASVFIHRQQKFGRMRDHMVIIVKLDQLYLVDVGFGRSSRYPIPLLGTSTCKDGTYRITKTGNYYLTQYHLDGEWNTQYKFHTHLLELEEFQESCDYVQNSPESIFTQGRLITQGTVNGRITLEETFFQSRIDDVVKKVDSTPEQFESYLTQHFNIEPY